MSIVWGVHHLTPIDYIIEKRAKQYRMLTKVTMEVGAATKAWQELWKSTYSKKHPSFLPVPFCAIHWHYYIVCNRKDRCEFKQLHKNHTLTLLLLHNTGFFNSCTSASFSCNEALKTNNLESTADT